MLYQRIRAFLRAEDGAITIDWVAITAGILMLGIAVVYAIFSNGVFGVTGNINGSLASVSIVDPGDPPDFSGTLADDPLGPLFSFLDGALDVAGDVANALTVAHEAGMELAEGTLAIGFTTAGLGTNPDVRQTLFSKDSQGFDSGGHLTVQVYGDDLWVRLQSPTESHIIVAADVISENASHDMAVSFGSDGMKVFLNGAMVGSDSYDGGIAMNGEPAVIGAEQMNSGDGVADRLRDPFGGTITSVQLYDTQTAGAGS